MFPPLDSANIPAAANRDPSRADLLKGVKCLIVDDQKELRFIIGYMLKKSGAVIAEAESVETALAQYVLFKPHVIVSDLAMPDQSGFDLMRRLRQEIEVGSPNKTPAVAVSAFNDETTRNRSLKEGFQCHLAKPVSREELVKVVAKLAHQA